jgi:hypothetical protein
MRLLKTHPILGLMNSYMIDVRCATFVLRIVILNNHNFQIVVTSSALGIGESSMPNTAWLLKGTHVANHLRYDVFQDVLFMVKAILPEDKLLMSSNVGIELGCNGFNIGLAGLSQ